MTSFQALAYGAKIHSDIDLSGHLAGGGEAIAEVQLSRLKGPLEDSSWTHSEPLFSSHGRELFLHSDEPLEKGEGGSRRALSVEGVVTFSWTVSSREIHYELGAEGNLQLLAFWFIHIFLPLYLSLERAFDFLHAGSVAIDGRAVLFIAPSTGGKSTLTEYFLRQGRPLVTDDKLATLVEGEQLVAVPSHGNYRPYRAPEDLGFRASEYASGALPVSAIYLLDRVGPKDAVSFAEVKGFRKFDRLMPNYIFGFRHMKVARMEYLARLANVVPVYEVSVPHDLERLADVYKAICEHSSEKI